MHPVNVIGTASDANLVSYTLLVAPVDSDTFTQIASGNTSVTAGVLGQFDPTNLANGAYTLRLQGTDIGGNVSTIDQTVNVAGDLKLGNFTLSFTDLSIPVSGIPITVTRTYDSLTSGSNGEFGYGWRLEFRDTNLRTSVPAPTPDEAAAGVYTAYRDRSHLYLTLPGGKREGFSFKAVPKPGFAGSVFGLTSPTFVPDRGVTDSLSAADATLIQGADGGYYDANGLAYNPADALNFGGVFTLTTRDGQAYTIDANTGLLDMVSNANGNNLTFTDASITSSAGPRITFARDPQGRIVSATDPAGQSVAYTYSAGGDLASVTDRNGNTTTFVYAAPGHPHFLTEVKDPLGRTGVRTEYDAQGRLITLRDAAGNPVPISYDNAASTETVNDPLGNPTTFVYDDFGNVVEQIDALGGHTRYTYDGNNNLLTETDPAGRTTTNTYDGNNNLLTTTDAMGNVTRNTYITTVPGFFARIAGARPVSFLASTTDPLGHTTKNTYDGAGNLTSTTDAAGNVTKYTYDGAGNQTSITDPAGHVTSFAYDASGHLLSQTDVLGHVTSYTYDANGDQLTQTTTVSGQTVTTTTAYDASGHPTAVTDAEGHTTTTVYDALGRQSSSTDALGHKTSFVYDTRGQLVESDFADGTKSTTTYDAAGRRTSSTDRAGRTTAFVYDALGRLIETDDPDGTKTTTTYDAAGQVTAQTDELGHKTTFTYDAAGRQTAVTDALGDTTTTTYDTAGRRIATTDALGHTTSFVYDALGRLTSTVYADGTTTSTAYDALGRSIAQTDQLGRVTHYQYDALGRLTEVVDALGQTTSYAYDEAGNLVTQTDANGHVTSYQYDLLGRKVATILPLGQKSMTVYDAVGNVASTTDFNGQTITDTYDANNRLIAQHFPDGTSTTYTYTATGQQATVTDARGVTTFSYDTRDRLLSRKDPDGTTISYTYDAAGNRTSVSIPAGTTTYTFDALNRTLTVTDPEAGVTSYTYDAVGELTHTAFPNGTSETRQYDSVGHLTYLENDGPSGVISSYRYTLAKTGRRDSVVEDTGRRVDYGYDALDRLTDENITDPVAGNRTIHYVYDPVGNRLTRVDSAEGETDSTYDANDRLLTETLAGVATKYTYDNNGNTLSKFTSAVDQAIYEWDSQNRMIGAKVTDSSGTKQIVYAYDADGIRVSSTVDGDVTKYLIDNLQPYAQVLEEYTPGGVIKVSYVYGRDLISQNRSGAKSFYGVDGLGSTRVLTNGSGVVTDRYIYDAFGRTIGQVGTTGNVYLFAGEQRDANVGLVYLRERYMNSPVGRFESRDPYEGQLFIPLTRNPYIYASVSPTNSTDPNGLFTLTEAVATVTIATVVFQLSYGVTSSILGTLHGKPDIKWTGELIAPSYQFGSVRAPRVAFLGVLHLKSESFKGQSMEGIWLLVGAGASTPIRLPYSRGRGISVPSLTLDPTDYLDGLGAFSNSSFGYLNVGIEFDQVTLYTPSVLGLHGGVLAGGFLFGSFSFSPFIGFTLASLIVGFGRGNLSTPIIVGFSIGGTVVAGASIPAMTVLDS
jgi:RHS repeat-associated protein